MKRLKILFLLCALLISATSMAQIDHDLRFTIRNLGVNVEGFFEESIVEGTLDLANTQNTSLKATIEVKSINTDNSTRDSHLLEDDYFDAANHPQIIFQSYSLRPQGTGKYELRGKLTIKGSTQDVKIPLELERGEESNTLKGMLPINRRDFDVGGGSFILSKNVKIYITLEIPRD